VAERIGQPATGDGVAGRSGVAERFVVPGKPGNAGGGKEPQFRTNAESGKGQEIGQPINSGKCSKTANGVTCKAKEEPGFRFYALYDKIYRLDVLTHAYDCCRANQGAAGVDGLTFEEVETYGRERWIGELAQQLREESYRPEAVRRVLIPKPNGKQRPLGIPRLADRVCQMAAMLVLDPLFEADMPLNNTPTVQTGVRRVHWLLTGGHKDVVEADLAGYFDTIPHAELMKSVARRIVDKRVLHLLRMWLNAPVEERDERGIPQGSPISPLLSNLYMRRFILGWKRTGAEQRLGAEIVNYADDLGLGPILFT
jgi:RNA-directed DNA polymerase